MNCVESGIFSLQSNFFFKHVANILFLKQTISLYILGKNNVDKNLKIQILTLSTLTD